MVLKNVFLSVALVALQAALGHANPIASQSLQRRVDCDDISKYTLQYFTDTKILEPEDSSCLFYTKYLSGTAMRYAKSSSLTTIWDMWSCEHYDGNKVDTNPLRCIFDDDATRTTYFEHMSEAMAISCNYSATVMTDDPNNIPQDGIWARIQQPALMRDNNPGGKRVDTIEAIDKRGDNSMTIWDRPSKLRLRGEEFKIVEGEVLDDEVLGSNSVLESRQDDRCFTPEQIDDWFGDVPF